MTDKLSWGEPGLPLLPPQWKHQLPKTLVSVPRTRNRKGAIHIQHLCGALAWGVLLKKNGEPHQAQNSVKWVAAFPNQTPGEFTVDALTQAGRDESFHDLDFMDTPILTGRIKQTETVRGIPFLVTTWELLLTHYRTIDNIAEMLSTCTALEVCQTTQSISATLDVAITAPSWCREDHHGYLEVTPAETPTNLRGAFSLAGARHLRTAGVDPRRSILNSPWCNALSSLAGIHPDGKMTLEKAGEGLGVTRERVRQIRQDYFLNHQIRRQWPLGDYLTPLKTLLEGSAGSSVEELNKGLSTFGEESGSLPWEKAVNLLAWYGHDIRMDFDATGAFQQEDSGLRLPHGLTLEKIRKTSWDLSGGTGFSRKPDLQRELTNLHMELPENQCAKLIQAAFKGQDLSMGYLFHSPSADAAVTGVFNRMLAWKTPLLVSELREGLVKRFRFRRMPAAPPLQVIRDLINFLPEYTISNDLVSPVSRSEKDTETLLGWIGKTLQESENGVLHRATILHKAREGGLNQTSVSIYLTFGEIVKPLGQGCYTLIGQSPRPEDIETARHETSHFAVRDKVQNVEVTPNLVSLKVTVGTGIRNSGNISPNAQIRRLIGERRFSIKSTNGTHGHAKLSAGALFYGFAPVMNALCVIPGEQIMVTLNFENNMAFVELIDEDAT